ncbi:WD40 repeat domain-containing serine/threonine protein kinase [Thermoactinospora rubra]|uniref:WD40 repeat domain-containing serine/threonine protein kinase n=1 Tax=Thermoactinospora rubra TaxID=1088767 RepID=UPI000A0F6562|nr:serine/threonine-protein kinase [Thermoactinospora rubra]
MEARIGDYELAGRLGSGGQGVVYDAYDPEGRRVAVKVLHPGGSRERFAKEAAAVARVASFCTAKVLAVELAGGQPYIVSEYVAGPSLRRAVRDGRRFGGDDLHRLGTAVATALTAIHDAGVVHRDLKPDNVLLGPDGPRVIDFGIATVAGMSLTGTGHIVGTPGYMAPEVFTGQRADPAADIFAWGAVMIFAATGEDPFTGENANAVAHRVLTARPDTSRLPAPIRPLVEAALAKDPEARPTARDLLLALVTGGSADTAELMTAGARAARGVQVAGHADPSLGTLAEDAYTSLPPAERVHVAEVFLRLVALGDQGAAVGELGPGAEPILRAFRYLLTENDGRIVLARAALVRAWPRLREWVAAEREGLTVLAEISAAARAWDDHGRRDGDLLRGSRLDKALSWAATGRIHATLTPRERDFLQAAAGLTRRQTRRRHMTIAFLASLLAVATAAAGAAAWQAGLAREQRDLAGGRQVAAEAERLRTTDPVQAMLLNVAAWRLAPGPGTKAGLVNALQAPERSVFRLPAAAGVGAVAAGGNGRIMAGVDEQGARLYDVPSGRTSAAWTWPAGQRQTPKAAALSPSGRILVVASQADRITAWEAGTGRKLGERPLGAGGEEPLVRFGDHESLVAIGRGTSVHFLWDTLAGRTVTLTTSDSSFHAPNGPLISADGAHVAATHLNELKLLRLPGLTVEDRAPKTCSAAAFTPDGGRLLCANGDITSYDLASDRRTEGPFWQASASEQMNTATGGLRSAGTVVAGYTGDTITVWTARRRLLEHRIDGQAQAVWLEPDGTALRYLRDDTIVTLDLRPRIPLSRPAGPLERAAGRRLQVGVTPSGEAVEGRDTSSGRLRWIYPRPDGWAFEGQAFTPDGRVYVAGLVSDDPARPAQRLVQLDTATGKVVSDRRLAGGLGRFAVASDGTTLVSQTGTFLDLRTGKPIRPGVTVAGHAVVAASPATPVIAVSGSWGGITLWDLRRRVPLAPSLRQGTDVSTDLIVFSPDGALVAAHGQRFDGGVVHVWDTATKTPLAVVPVDDIVEDMAFTPDGTLLAAGRRTTFEVPTNGDRLAQAVCRRAARALTVAEWERHLPGVPYRHVC